MALGSKILGSRVGPRVAVRAGVAVQVLLAVCLVAGLNLLTARNPIPGLRGDWTVDSANTLHPDTAGLFRAVKDPVELVLFRSPLAATLPAQRAFNQEVYRKTDLLIREAAFLNQRITVESINPVTNPDRARAAIERTGLEATASMGSFLLVHARGRNIQLPFPQLATLDPRSGQLRYQGEDALYKAMAEVTRRQARLVTFVLGHGEFDPVKADEGLPLASRLNREAYRIARCNLARGENIQDGTSVLVIARPLTELSPEALAAISAYHRDGGNVLLAVGARTPAANLRRYLETQFKLALRADDEMLYDPKGALPRFPEWIVADSQFNVEHPITRPLARSERKVAVVLPRVRPLTLKAPGVCDYLVSSHPGAWPDKQAKGFFDRRLEDEEKLPSFDKLGFPMAVSVDPRNPRQQVAGAKAGRLVLICSGEAAGAQFLENFPANATLLVNAVHWLSGKDAGERVAPVAVRVSRLTLTAADDRLLFWLVVALPSAVMIVLAGLVFFMRRG